MDWSVSLAPSALITQRRFIYQKDFFWTDVDAHLNPFLFIVICLRKINRVWIFYTMALRCAPALAVAAASLIPTPSVSKSCCEQRVSPATLDPPLTLRRWLSDGKFMLSISQGFTCEPQSLGAVLALSDALGGDAALRSRLTAVSGSSSGAKIAALTSLRSVELAGAAETLLALQPAEVFLDSTDLVPPWRGGLLGGEGMVRIQARLWGHTARVEDCCVPFGTTAFDVSALSVVHLRRGDLSRVCQASGSVPLFWAPMAVCAADVDVGAPPALLRQPPAAARDTSPTSPPGPIRPA